MQNYSIQWDCPQCSCQVSFAEAFDLDTVKIGYEGDFEGDVPYYDDDFESYHNIFCPKCQAFVAKTYAAEPIIRYHLEEKRKGDVRFEMTDIWSGKVGLYVIMTSDNSIYDGIKHLAIGESRSYVPSYPTELERQRNGYPVWDNIDEVVVTKVALQ